MNHRKLLILTPPVVTGAEVKNYRQGLRMSVDAFAAVFKTTRQNVARLERLTRPLTDEEFRSFDLVRKDKAFNPSCDRVILSIDSRKPKTH